MGPDAALPGQRRARCASAIAAPGASRPTRPARPLALVPQERRVGRSCSATSRTRWARRASSRRPARATTTSTSSRSLVRAVRHDPRHARRQEREGTRQGHPQRRPAQHVGWVIDRRPEPDDRPHVAARRAAARRGPAGRRTSPSRPGGKGLNVARAALDARARAGLARRLHPGYTGRAAAAMIAEEGVTLQGVPVPGEIRSTAIVLEPGGRATVLNEPGPELRGRRLGGSGGRDRRRAWPTTACSSARARFRRARRRTATRCWSRGRATRGALIASVDAAGRRAGGRPARRIPTSSCRTSAEAEGVLARARRRGRRRRARRRGPRAERGRSRSWCARGARGRGGHRGGRAVPRWRGTASRSGSTRPA